MVASLFLSTVVAEICGIAISPRSQIDRMRWSGTKNGDFSVHNAYHLAVEGLSKASGSCSNPVSSSPFWKCLWTLNVPHAVQMLLWRGFNNMLLTKEKLYHQKVVPEPFCPSVARRWNLLGIFSSDAPWLLRYGRNAPEPSTSALS